MVKEINNQYVRERFGSDLSQGRISRTREAMQKYGDNHWWESDDDLEIAMYQISEGIRMVDFSRYRRGLDQLMGRHVSTLELAANMEDLREEAEPILSNLVAQILEKATIEDSLLKPGEEPNKLLPGYYSPRRDLF
jgi:hypothetical protein